ncbi:hypothetical protein GBAR_LOCUS4136 [Geodia barretti]|uniref:Uncharacterized protein n=1 Tax=Geodia barretti TaxID=519541 RepID=A0AA35W611_GEOBA|nr:hypothetical protein GBAR_LOCUS4136 [Geodia barretti]
MRVAEGFARKVSLAFIGISFIGWIVFTAGFGRYKKWLDDNEDHVSVEESYLYAFRAGSMIGPFVHFLAIAHVLLWGLPSSIVGSITAVVSIMYLSAVGYGMVLGGIYINTHLMTMFLMIWITVSSSCLPEGL